MRTLLLVGVGLLLVLLIFLGFRNLTAFPRLVANVGRAKSELITRHSLLDRFFQDCGRYPTTQEGLIALWQVPPDLKKRWRGPYCDPLDSNDPFGTPYSYISVTPGHYELKCLGADGELGGEEDDQDLIVMK
jgi:general secretion pathway protein G